MEPQQLTYEELDALGRLCVLSEPEYGPTCQEDIDLVGPARAALPRLISEVRRLRAENTHLRAGQLRLCDESEDVELTVDPDDYELF